MSRSCVRMSLGDVPGNGCVSQMHYEPVPAAGALSRAKEGSRSGPGKGCNHLVIWQNLTLHSRDGTVSRKDDPPRSRPPDEFAARTSALGVRGFERRGRNMDYNLIDADNHYYETEDAFTRHGDEEVKGLFAGSQMENVVI